MSKYTKENGYYLICEDEHGKAPAGSVYVRAEDDKRYWYRHPQAGFHAFPEDIPDDDIVIPDGSVAVFSDGHRWWYRHPHVEFGLPGTGGTE